MGNLCTKGIPSTSRTPTPSRADGSLPQPPQRSSSSAPGRGGLLDGLRRRQVPPPDSGARLQQIRREVDGLLVRASNHPDRQSEETDLLRLAQQIDDALRDGSPLPGLGAQLDYFRWRLQEIEPPPAGNTALQPARRLPPPGPSLHDMEVSDTDSDPDLENRSTGSNGAEALRTDDRWAR